MVAISKYDKQIWENYVSNFEKYVLLPQKDCLVRTRQNDNKYILKNKKLLKTHKSFNKKKIEADMILDLHGYTLYSAKILLHKIISKCYEKNVRNILIITGKGQNNKGVLKEEVPKWLNDKFLNKFIVKFNVAPAHSGGEGALLVRIKNKFKI